MKSKNSLNQKVWGYFILFSVIVLSSLWLFQVVFFKRYYEWVKSNELAKVASVIEKEFTSDTYEDILDQIAFQNNVCIEVSKMADFVYSSNMFGRGCLPEKGPVPHVKEAIPSYRSDFMASDLDKKSYEFTNPRFDNKTLLYALRLDQYYVYVSTSLDPIDSTIVILQKQLFYVSIGVLILSFFIAYFISKKISRPIVKINQAARKMAAGEYDVVFATQAGIQEIEELTTTLNYTRDELAKTEALRHELMANVGHDLKTPLTMIKAYAEMVRDLSYDHPTKRTENLNVIIEETDRLNLLVNDILDLSQMQADMLTLQPSLFDLTLLIETILKRYQILVEQEDYQFIFEETDCCLVMADRKRMEQVIYNLLNNAVNYTGDDHKIYIRMIKNNGNVRVEIQDTGQGIDSEDVRFIWDKYYKIDKKYQRAHVGTGLGLSIVKKILMAHHFLYGVRCDIEKGTIFYFELPIQKD